MMESHQLQSQTPPAFSAQTSPGSLEDGDALNSPANRGQLTLEWKDLEYTVGPHGKTILSGCSGYLEAGELLAIMGPSGAGKSTMLDCLTARVKPSHGEVLLSGSTVFSVADTYSFVEQDDALMGVLTVRETVTFAALLSIPRGTVDINARVIETLQTLGLQDVANNRIGTIFQRGISGGQKRRVTIACSMVARPLILVLDEPTSGLDATSGQEVMKSLKALARMTNTICIASIHQPNHDTYSTFDKVLLLARGRTMFSGRAELLNDYLNKIQMPVPRFSSPADHAMTVLNTDFHQDREAARRQLDDMSGHWTKHGPGFESGPPSSNSRVEMSSFAENRKGGRGVDGLFKSWILTKRNFLNYSRNLLAYGIRFAMYLGMGLMIALIWIRLGDGANKVNDRLSVYFYSVAFLGFMSVAGIPSFLEERALFVRERGNGLYKPIHYLTANTLTTLPFLFACTLVYSVIMYFAVGLHPGGTQFFRFVLYLFLGVFIAETQATFIAAAVPIFVAALAMSSFLNGFFMSVGGYFLRAPSLPRFWYYSFHFIDYQTFTFELLVRNDLLSLRFPCETVAGACSCPFPSSLGPAQCALAGSDVVNALGYGGVNDGLYVGILIIIAVVYRGIFWAFLVWRRR